MAKAEKTLKAQTSVAQVSDADLSNFVGYRMKRSFNVVQADLARTLKPFELRMTTYTALLLIIGNPGMRQAQLADAMDVERPNLVVIIDELEGRELITRDRVPTDRRAYALKATLAGRRLCDKAVAAVEGHEKHMFSEWDEETKATVIRALGLIHRRKDEV
jgi:DNA-binding MarR family transcriptional regulator